MYDVAVIGAGPAGSMAAWKIAEKGHQVLILDRRKQVGHPIQCGEGLSRYAIESNGLKPDASWIKQETKGARIIVPNGKHVLVKGEGYSIDRGIFDRHIAKLARDAGAELRLETRVTGIEKNEDNKGLYYVIRTSKGDHEARYVIGADGPHSIVAKWAGIAFEIENVVGYQYKFDAGYVEENIHYDFQGRNLLDGEWLDFHYASRFPDGYVWVFPRGNEYNIGICGPGGLKERLDAYCREMGLNPEKKMEINAGQIPRGTIIPEFVRDNVLIVGDAAGLTNPITKGGIHAALFSARQAGLVLSEALEENDPEIAKRYDHIMRDSPFTDPVMMKYGKLIYSLTDEAANFIGDLLDGRNYNELSCPVAAVKLLKRPKLLPFIPRFLRIIKALNISSKYGW